VKILSISRWEYPGGAEASAYRLFQSYRDAEHESWLAVGTKRYKDPNIFEIPRRRYLGHASGQIRAWRDQHTGNKTLAYRLLGYVSVLPVLPHYMNQIRGRENFYYPGTYKILHQLPAKPDIVHCHNLHSNYFDIRALPWLSKQSNLILNMRDAWLMTGHCAYTGECSRWRHGCGNCPDLERYVSIAKDESAYNHSVKIRAFAKAKYHLTAPSKWLLDQAEDSPLGKFALSKRVVPNGIDVLFFCPMNKDEARKQLGIDPEAKIVLFAGHHGYKDIDTMQQALTLLPPTAKETPYWFLCFGKEGKRKRLGDGVLDYLGFIHEPSTLRAYYSAADVYLHAAEGEAFGKTITEAMACGTPVVVTATGGIPEQVDHGTVGFVAGHKNASELAHYINILLSDTVLNREMSETAVKHVNRLFTLKRQANAFIDWYREILWDNNGRLHV
jgi:glycosyltransferase involved in cell wall biosynthesis